MLSEFRISPDCILTDGSLTIISFGASACTAALTAEAVTALIATLKDENERVRDSAAYALWQGTQQTVNTVYFDSLDAIRNALSVPGIDEISMYTPGAEKVYDLLFDTLNAIAPLPRA